MKNLFLSLKSCHTFFLFHRVYGMRNGWHNLTIIFAKIKLTIFDLILYIILQIYLDHWTVKTKDKAAGAELGQAHVKLEVVDEDEVKV